MAILNPRQLKQEAAHRLSRGPSDPRLQVLLYTGVMVGLNLLVNGLNLLLNEQISGTGGLSGLGARSMLQTVQTLLTYFSAFFSPFWLAGFLYSMIRTARLEQTQPTDMLFGFRRGLRVLSHSLLDFIVLFGVMYVCLMIACYAYLFTPLSNDFAEAMMPLLESGALITADGMINMEVVPMELIYQAGVPVMIIFLLLFLPAYVFLSYCLRLSLYLLLEGPQIGAIGSYIQSLKLMKGHKFQMLKLDLSFWWYYLLEAALAVVCYLDVILPALGIELPFNATVAYFVSLALYGVLQIALYVWKKAEVETTYVLAYEAIAHPEEA